MCSCHAAYVCSPFSNFGEQRRSQRVAGLHARLGARWRRKISAIILTVLHAFCIVSVRMHHFAYWLAIGRNNCTKQRSSTLVHHGILQAFEGRRHKGATIVQPHLDVTKKSGVRK